MRYFLSQLRYFKREGDLNISFALPVLSRIALEAQATACAGAGIDRLLGQRE
jgi:hypothetical protein